MLRYFWLLPLLPTTFPWPITYPVFCEHIKRHNFLIGRRERRAFSMRRWSVCRGFKLISLLGGGGGGSMAFSGDDLNLRHNRRFFLCTTSMRIVNYAGESSIGWWSADGAWISFSADCVKLQGWSRAAVQRLHKVSVRHSAPNYYYAHRGFYYY